MVRAMILAAGRGERMRPLTDTCPKPLLPVAGKPLIEWHLETLGRLGRFEPLALRSVVINHAHLGSQIEARLGHGERWNLDIHYSPEPPGALETAGGIAQALPWLDPQQAQAPFLVINGDVWCEWGDQELGNWLDWAIRCVSPSVAHDLASLVLVPNPPHHPAGDFTLDGDRVVPKDEAPTLRPLTYAGIGVYSPVLFKDVPPGQPAKLAPLLHAAARAGRLGGYFHPGRWEDVGTPARLQALDAEVHQRG